MPRAGAHPTSPDRDDQFEQAERQYRAETKQEPPVFGVVKLRVHDKHYMYDSVRPILREALELHLPRAKRSQEAVWLEALLHADELDDYAVFRAKGALLRIYEQLKPL